MTNSLKLKINDLVVRHGKVLKVSKISKNSVDLQPFFESQSSNGLTFTLNLSQVNGADIRKLTSKPNLKKLIALINKKFNNQSKLPAFDIKTAFSQNKLEETLKIIKTLYLEKSKKDNILLGGKLTTLKLAMIQATNEIAATNGISPQKAEQLLKSSLKIK